MWHPIYRGDEEKLESVQHRMSRLVPELRGMEYIDRLKKLNLPTLYYRRARGDMIECFKYLTGIYAVGGVPLPRDTKSNTRGHSFKLLKPYVKTSIRQNFFSNRVVNAWNSLPEEVVTASTLNQFKNRLDRLWSEYKYLESSDWFRTPPKLTLRATTNQSIV